MDHPTSELTSWVDDECETSTLGDERLGYRLRKLLSQLSGAIGKPIPMACQDWANTKAAYRFLSNKKVNEQDILAGHFHATANRFLATTGPILVLQDTTEFSYTRNEPSLIGSIGYLPGRKIRSVGSMPRKLCGLLMHSSLVVTPEGLPLGLSAIKFWSRSKFKGTNALKRSVNPTRIPIEHKESIRWLENMQHSNALLGEAGRCIHIGDRENDIFEFFSDAVRLGTHFLVRTCVDRLAGDGGHTIAKEMNAMPVQAIHEIKVRDQKGNMVTASVELKYKRIHVLPPIGKQKCYSPLDLTVIHACERHTPEDRDRIDWKLITDLSVTSPKQAIKNLQWYAMRWKIEVFHKILKSGCQAEHAKLRTAERLVNLLAIYCVLGWRIFWMTMVNRTSSDTKPQIALTDLEVKVLDQIIKDKLPRAKSSQSLSTYLIKIAKLGGYLARTHDPPPGNIVMWRGWSRLTDITLGATIRRKLVGN